MAPRLLVSCFPGHGHLQPLLPLATACRQAGWDVLVSTGPDLVPAAQRHGLPAISTGLSSTDTEAALFAGRPDIARLPRKERLQAVLPAMFVDIAARSRIRQLIDLIDRWRPDLVLHDVTEFAAPVAAMQACLPRVAHGVSLVSPSPQLVTALRPAVDRLAAEHGMNDGTERWRTAPYLDICPPSLRGTDHRSFDCVLPIRPQAAAAAEGARLPAALDALPFHRTVHVTLGTVVNDAAGLLDVLLAGAVTRPANVVVTVGPDRDPRALGPLPPSVLAERYLPLSLLLPRCSAVVCHAGAGTLLATLASGLPAVLVPVGAEQAHNAELAAAAGVAVVLRADEVTPHLVGEALGAILENRTFAARAATVATDIAAMPTPESLVPHLEALATASSARPV